MRTDTKVDGRPVLAIWTTRAVKYTSSSVHTINGAVRSSGIGKTQEKRDFMKSGCTDKAIVRGLNNVRQSCVALYMDDPRWPSDLVTDIYKGTISLCQLEIL